MLIPGRCANVRAILRKELTGELTPGLRLSACVVTKGGNHDHEPKSNDKAREPYRKGANELLEAPFPQASREFAEKTVDQTRQA